MQLGVYRTVVLLDLALLAVFLFVWIVSQADSAVLSYLSSNQKPVAVAGFDQAVDEDSLTTSLNGSNSSDPDGGVNGTALSYSWAELQDTADGCSLSGFTDAQPVVTLLNRLNDYNCTFQLTVDDGLTESSVDEVTVFVTAHDDAPVILGLGDMTVTTTDRVSFTVRGRDPEGLVIEYDISDETGSFTALGLEPIDFLALQAGSAAEFSWQPQFEQAGIYTLLVSVSDGVTTTKQPVQVTVQQANIAPVFTGALPVLTLTVSDTAATVFDLDDYFSDANHDALTYSLSGVTHQTITMAEGEVTITTDAQATSEIIYFKASDTAGHTTSSNAVMLTTVPAAQTDLISYVTGTNRGAGIVTLFDQRYTKQNHWIAFEQGGAVPYLLTTDVTNYVAVLRNQRGRMLKLFTQDGVLLDQIQLSPAVPWEFVGEANFDGNSSTVEVVLRGKHKNTAYLRVLQFASPELKWEIIATTSIRNFPESVSFGFTKTAVQWLRQDGTMIDSWLVNL
jgi:hypothetical protein